MQQKNQSEYYSKCLNKATYLIHAASQSNHYAFDGDDKVGEWKSDTESKESHFSTWVMKPISNTHIQDMGILSTIISYK